MVSLHAHEFGGHEEIPAAFLPIFARRMIDEGAQLWQDLPVAGIIQEHAGRGRRV